MGGPGMPGGPPPGMGGGPPGGGPGGNFYAPPQQMAPVYNIGAPQAPPNMPPDAYQLSGQPMQPPMQPMQPPMQPMQPPMMPPAQGLDPNAG